MLIYSAGQELIKGNGYSFMGSNLVKIVALNGMNLLLFGADYFILE